MCRNPPTSTLLHQQEHGVVVFVIENENEAAAWDGVAVSVRSTI